MIFGSILKMKVKVNIRQISRDKVWDYCLSKRLIELQNITFEQFRNSLSARFEETADQIYDEGWDHI